MICLKALNNARHDELRIYYNIFFDIKRSNVVK